MFHRNLNENKEGVRRLPSAPSGTSNSTPNSTSLPIQEIFRRSGHWSHRGDVAGGDSGKIKNFSVILLLITSSSKSKRIL